MKARVRASRQSDGPKWPRQVKLSLCMAAGLCLAAVSHAGASDDPDRFSLWIDLYLGEPVSYNEVLGDLAGVRVIYLGERHRVQRHHDLQAQLVADLAKRGVPLVLGLEQLSSPEQPVLDRYWQGKIDFDELASQTQWAKSWGNYAQYKPVLEAARKAGAVILALNARTEVIRQVARGGGVARLDPALRRELPAELRTDDPPYERLLNLQMMVHAATNSKRLRPMVEAQIARDEAMAATLAGYLQSPAGRGRTAVVLCGAGHVAYGLGMPERVRRRIDGLKDRILLMSESGDVELTPAERAAARAIDITHEQLREIGRPVADYLYATSPRQKR